jgi:hypothetical protein
VGFVFFIIRKLPHTHSLTHSLTHNMITTTPVDSTHQGPLSPLSAAKNGSSSSSSLLHPNSPRRGENYGVSFASIPQISQLECDYGTTIFFFFALFSWLLLFYSFRITFNSRGAVPFLCWLPLLIFFLASLFFYHRNGLWLKKKMKMNR